MKIQSQSYIAIQSTILNDSASNIAVKLNTKLSGLMDRTAAWNSSPLDGNVPGIQWSE
jgi:hypothetical protein